MAIIISKDGRNAQKVDRSSFDNEDYLQKYIYENPESVPLYEIEENIRLLILAREFPTASGYIDAVGIDEQGEIYVIETKLYKNPDKRLVVAQVLDYGASLAFNNNDSRGFLNVIETKVHDYFKVSLNEKISGYFQIDGDSTLQIIENVKNNLSKGKFRFVVLMDSINDRLRDLIIFLNKNSRFDIYGVELEYYKHNDFEIIIPKLHGAEVKKEITESSTSNNRKKWNEILFLNEIEAKRATDEILVIKDLYNFSNNTSDKINWGTGSQNGSFSAVYLKVCPRSIFSVFTDGTLSINFHWMDASEEMRNNRDKLISMTKKVFNLPEDFNVSTIHISMWKHRVKDFEKTISSFLQEK